MRLHEWLPGPVSDQLVFYLNSKVFISFNPSPPVSFLYPDMRGPQETALVIELDEKIHYLILEGDFRSQYEAAFWRGGGLAVYHLFLEQRTHHESTWSQTKDWKRLQRAIVGG